MKLNFVTRFNLVMLMVLFVGLALDFAPESARKEVEPIKEPEPVGYPEMEFTIYEPDNTI
tara:strand:+ start:563 stop:742 length:180 start_codon:yes stop_codon:yes gene_type:complete